MNIIGSLIARFNNFKRNPPTLDRKDKISSLKTNIIMNNTAKARKDDNFNSLNNKSNPKCEDKREGRFYNKNNNNKNGKIRVAKLNKYYKKKKKLEP